MQHLTQKIQASDKQAGDFFSYSVALHGDWALVGSSWEDTGENDAGAAYLFQFQNGIWVEKQKIQASDKQAGDLLGHSVALHGDWALVGASWEDTGGIDAGAAYLFQFQNGIWVEKQKIQASDKQTRDLFVDTHRPISVVILGLTLPLATHPTSELACLWSYEAYLSLSTHSSSLDFRVSHGI